LLLIYGNSLVVSASTTMSYNGIVESWDFER